MPYYLTKSCRFIQVSCCWVRPFAQITPNAARPLLTVGKRVGHPSEIVATSDRATEHDHDISRAGMDERYTWDKIDRETFDDLLAQYPDVLPPKLMTLDEQRYRSIPATVRERKDDAHLTKEEAFTLVTWKFYILSGFTINTDISPRSHGKFRPTLKVLLQQNSEEAVASTTREAFAVYKAGGGADSRDALKSSLGILTKLRGIGPATASLFLSVYDPQCAPFFAVGLFAWATGKKGRGREWEQGIKYNLKEYLELAERVAGFRRRLNVSAADAEKAGYVLGHTVGGKEPTVAPQMEKGTKEKKGKRSLDSQEQSHDPLPSKRTSKRLKSKPSTG